MGYFSQFYGDDTILLAGDPPALRELAVLLRGLESRHACPVEVHTLSFVTAFQGVELTAFPVGRELGVRRIGPKGPRFGWYHSEEGWLEAAEKIERIVESGKGHNWLDCIGVEDARLMVSLNEYSYDWWASAGHAQEP